MKILILMLTGFIISFFGIFHSVMAQPMGNFRTPYPIGELVKLPHPGRVVVQYERELGITEAQKDRLNKEIRAVFGREIMFLKREIYSLELQAKEMILSNTDRDKISKVLDQITAMKRDLVELRIRFYTNCKKILTPEQWSHVLAYLRDGTLPDTQGIQGDSIN